MECVLESHPQYGGCCCQCKFRLRALDHQSDRQIGWACVAFAFMEGEDIAYLGDFEHGICELFMQRKCQTSPTPGAGGEQHGER